MARRKNTKKWFNRRGSTLIDPTQSSKFALSENEFYHESILVAEILRDLEWTQCSLLADFTVGGGGHLEALLKSNPKPERIVACDQDLEALRHSQMRLKDFENIEWKHMNFSKALLELGPSSVYRGIADLGVSSRQLDDASRGMSFQKEGPMDLRMDQSSGESAADWLMHCDESSLAQIIRDYGEESRAKLYARRWIENRSQFRASSLTTTEFVRALGHDLSSKTPWGRHPLTRVFQALRIAVNREMEVLDQFLESLPSLLAEGGRIAILTFHSLEDRKVKWALKGRLRSLHKKVVVASEDECQRNPRARSAKLRVYEKNSDEGT